MAEHQEHGAVSEETERAEHADEQQTPKADRPPTPSEEQAAETQPLDPEVATAYREAAERGAAVRGEGEIEPSDGA